MDDYNLKSVADSTSCATFRLVPSTLRTRKFWIVLVASLSGWLMVLDRTRLSALDSKSDFHSFSTTTTTTTTSTMTATNSTTTIAYSRLRNDRSGAEILDMLLAHQYAFLHNWTFGGACGFPRRSPDVRRHKQTQDLVRQLFGTSLASLLKFACPPKNNSNSIMNNSDAGDNSYNHVILKDSDYTNGEYATFSASWRDYIQRQYLRPWFLKKQQELRRQDINTTGNSKSDEIVVAVHIRRGDVYPCRRTHRYLPNSHYQSILRRYVLNNTKIFGNNQKDKRPILIKIHSETASFEPWNCSANYWIQDVDDDKLVKPTTTTTRMLNPLCHAPPPLDLLNTTSSSAMCIKNRLVRFQFHFNAPLHTVWLDMILANILVMSRSSFSYAPAALRVWNVEENDAFVNQKRSKQQGGDFINQVIYTPGMFPPLPDWTVVDDGIYKTSMNELQSMKSSKRCNPK